MTENKIIAGAKKGGSGRTPVEAPDSLRSIALARVLDLVSEGEILGLANGLQSVYLDETPLENPDGSLNFKNVQVEFRSGTQDQEYIPGFPSVESEIPVNVELKHGTPWVRAINNTSLSAVSLRLSVPALQKSNKDNGDIKGHTIKYTIQVAVDGGSYETALTSAFSGKTTSKYEKSHRIDLPPAESNWTIRVIRNTPNENSSSTADLTFIESMVEIIDAKLRYPNSAIIGMAVDAEQFQSVPTRAYDLFGRIVRVPSNYDPITRTYEGSWDGTFKPSWTDNPAWIFYDIMTNTRFGLGHLVDPSMLDKWQLYKIGRYCDELVPNGNGGMEPRFSCNVYYQTRAEAYKVVRDLGSAFRAMVFWAGGQVRAVADMPEDPVYIYNSSNVVNGKFVYQGSRRKERHTVALVSWNDMDDFGRAKIEYVEDVDGIERYGVQQIEVTAIGCTSRSQANRLGRWILFTERYETNSVSFEVGEDGSVAAPGQIIVIADPDRAGRRIGGRISDATKNSITVDKIPSKVGIGDHVRVMMPDATLQTRIIQSIAGNKITVTSDFTTIPQRQSAWAVESEELATQRYRVMSVEESAGIGYTINAVQHAEGKFDEIEHGIKWDPPNLTALPPKVQHGPTNVTIDFRDIAGEINAGTVITISWDAVPGAIRYEIEWRQGEGSWVWGGETTGTTYDIYGAQPGPFEVRITAINATGMKSNPIRTEPVEIPDTVLKPRVIQRLEESADELSRRIAKEELDRMAGDTKEAQDRAAAIKTEAERIAEEMGALADELDEESAARVAAIDQVASDLTKEVTERTKHVTETVASETEARTAAIKVVADALAQEVTDRTDAVNTAAGELWESVGGLETRIGEEANARAAAVATLQGEIDEADAQLAQEVANRKADVESLTGSIAQVATDLESEAAALQSGIDTVVADLTAEVTARQTAVGKVQDAVDSVASDLADEAHAIRQEQAQTVASLTGTIDGLSAQVADLLEADEHDPAKTYPQNDLVQSGGKLYNARQDVPAGIAISNDAYWQLIGNYNSLVDALGNTVSRVNVHDVRIQSTDDEIDAIAEDLTALETEVDGKASSGAVTALTTRVTANETEIGSLSQAVTSLDTELDGKASTGAVSALTTRVTENEEGINALSESLESLETVVDGKASQTAVSGLTTRVTETEEALVAQGTSITDLQSGLADKADQSAMSSLTTRVTDAEGLLQTQGSDITSLQGSLPGKADASALSALDTRVTETESGIESLGSDLTALSSTVADKADSSALTALTTRVTVNEDGIDTINESIVALGAEVDGKASGSAVSSLSNRVTATEDEIDSLGESLTALETEVDGKASGAALTSLTNRVTTAEGAISSHGESLTSLDNRVTDAESGVASNASAISGLATRVESTESGISTLASDLTSLGTVVDGKASSDALNALTSRVEVTEDSIESHSGELTSLRSSLGDVKADSGVPTFRQPDEPQITGVRRNNATNSEFVGGLSAVGHTGGLSPAEIDGFAAAILVEKLPSGQAQALLSKTPYEPGALHTISVFVEIEGDPPVIGRGETADFVLFLRAEVITGAVVTHVRDNLYRVSAPTTPSTGAENWAGVRKRADNSDRPFKVTGVQLELGELTSYQRVTNPTDFDGSGLPVGSIWHQTNESDEVIGTYRYNGATWDGVDHADIAANASAISSLDTRVTDTEAGISAVSTDLTALETVVGGKASSSALSALTTRVTDAEGTLSTVSQALTDLGTVVDGKASTGAVNALTTRVTDAEGELTALTEDLAALTATVDGKASAGAVSALTTRVTDAEGELASLAKSILDLSSVVDGKASSEALSALTTRVTETEGSIETHSQSLTSLEGRVEETEAGVSGNAGAISGLDTRVVANEGGISTLASDLTALSAVVDDKASSGALSGLESRVAANESGISTLSKDYTELSSKVDNKAESGAVQALETRVEETEGGIESLGSDLTALTSTVAGKADGKALSSLTSRVTDAEGEISSLSEDLTELSGTVDGKADGSALTALTTRVEATEGSTTSQGKSITALEGRVDTVEGDVAKKADGSALSALETRVTEAEGEIESTSRDVTSLNSSIGDIRADSGVPTFRQPDEPQITGVRRNLFDDSEGDMTAYSHKVGCEDAGPGLGFDNWVRVTYNPDNISYAYKIREGGEGIASFYAHRDDFGPITIGSSMNFTVTGGGSLNITETEHSGVYRVWCTVPEGTSSFGIVNRVGLTNDIYITGFQKEDGVAEPTPYQAVRSPTDFDGSGLPAGSIWYDTGNGNRPHRYNGSTWDPIDDTRVGAQANAIEDLSSRVTQTEAGVVSHSSSLTSLDNRLDTAETGLAGVVQTTRANSEAIAGLDSRIASNEEGIESVQSSVVSLSGRIESTESDVSGLQAGVEAATEAVSGLSSRVSATEGSVSSVSGEVTSLRNTINNGTTGLASKASAAAVSDLSNRVEQTEGAISSQSASVTALENAINHPSTGLGTKASASALQTLTNQVNHSTTGLATKAASSAVTALQNQINNATTGLPSKASSSALSVLESRVSEVESTAFETTHLASRVDTIESALVHEMITSANQNSALNSSVNVLSGKMETAEGKILANANAVSGLTTRMTNAEGKVESQGSHLTRLQSQVNALDLDAGGAGSAISELDTRVTSAEGKLVSQGNAITALQNSVTSANKTFIQPGQPSTTGRTNGDLWIDTDDSNKLYGFLNGKWELRQDSGKNTIFVQGTQPVAKAVNDLWFDTARNNRQFRWNGSAWVEITDTRVAANASAITGLTNRVTSIEGVNTTQSQQITTLQNTVNNSTRGVTATANGLAALTTRVTDAEGSISSHSTDITQLKNTVNHSTTGVTATSNALNALTSRVTAAEGVNTSQGSAITALQNTVNNSTTGVTATANALSALTTRVSNAETSVSSNGSAITSLQNTVNNSKTGVTATASALSALTTRVSTAEGKVNSHASSISSLSTTVGSHTTTITSHSSSINGLRGKAGVTIDANGYLTGWALHNNGKSGTMTVVADRFRIVTPGQTARTPFSLTSSVLQLNTDLQMGGGVLWNKGATHSAILGPAGSSGEFLFWAGKNPTSAAAATKTNAAMYVDKNGAAAFSGTLHSSLLSASAMELNSMRIHSGGGRLCPFTIEDFAYRGLGTGNTSMTLTLSGFKAPNNGSAGFDAKRFAAHRMDVIMEANLNGDRGWETVRFQVQYNGGAWENLASLRTNCNYRGGATLISRYTTKGSWSTVNFRCVTSEGNTQTLAFRLSVKNYYESSNTAHSFTGADASSGGGGNAPPPGGGWNPDPGGAVVLP